MSLSSSVAADGSDLVVIQAAQNLTAVPSGASETMNVRGFVVDQGAVIANAAITNTVVGNFTGKH